VINLRYHIVSITAVFLALGIGLTLGTSFLDRVTVDELKHRLDEVQSDVDRTEAANERLSGRVNDLEDRDRELATELPERLVTGRLDGVPVLVVAAEGTDAALVDQTVGALSAAGAEVTGTWWLTERWLLDDAEEVNDLGGVLELNTTDADRLRRNGAIRVAELLDTAAEPPADLQVAADPQVPADPQLPVVEAAPPQPSEPELVAALEAAGFIDYTALAGADDARVLLPAADTRYVVISDALPDAGPALFAAALLDEIAADGVAPVVAAQGEADLRDAEDELAPEDDRRTTFVGPLRAGELTHDRISTVDDLDTASGLLATVLAVEDLSAELLGHYGVAPGAARLLPGPVSDT
jgi:hypothetical protein